MRARKQLREASEIKSRFLSNMSHEFRTPLNSIMALSRLLLDGIDGDLNSEQQKQIGYIRKSAQDLLEMVGDLLDLAKVEAGKLEVKPQHFTVKELFSLLRGALKPLRQSGEVELIFDGGELPEMFTDEGKVAQILRNFISNALKFTEAGEVHVSAHLDSRTRTITFAVSDTGIGIAPADQERIFEEFTQVEGRHQKAAKGTGLGLPLSRKLAGLLGGELWVESELGKGSTFFLSIPIDLPGFSERPVTGCARGTYSSSMTTKPFAMYCVRSSPTTRVAPSAKRAMVQAVSSRFAKSYPDLVILDLQMPRMDGFEVLQAMRSDPRLKTMPVIVSTSLQLEQEPRAAVLEGVPILPKHAISRERVRSLLREAFEE